MKNLFLALGATVVLIALGVTLKVGPPNTGATVSGMTAGDSALAAAGSFKIYPLFTPGGAHIHAPQWVSVENGFTTSAQSGYIYTTVSQLRVKVWGPDADTSGFTVPANGTQTALPTCDSVQVLNTGGTATVVTWGLFR